MKRIARFIILLLMFPGASSAETIEGSVMMWETGELLNGSAIKIYKDSELVSQVISEDGRYKAEIPRGRYDIKAIYIDNSGGVYAEEESISVEGNTTLDFIMLVPELELSDEDYDISELSDIEKVLAQMDIPDSGKREGALPSISDYLLSFVLIGAALAIAFVYFTRRKKGNAIKLTKGMQNVIGTLGENESQLVLFLVKHNGLLRRTELARGTEMSKSSLSVALNKLEEKKIVEIDRTFVTHEVRLTGWFKSL